MPFPLVRYLVHPVGNCSSRGHAYSIYLSPIGNGNCAVAVPYPIRGGYAICPLPSLPLTELRPPRVSHYDATATPSVASPRVSPSLCRLDKHEPAWSLAVPDRGCRHKKLGQGVSNGRIRAKVVARENGKEHLGRISSTR